MTVSVYEIGSGLARAQLEGYCRHLTTGGTFSPESQPTRTWVDAQLNLDAAYIAARIVSCGFTPTQTDIEVLQFLQLWNTLRSAMAVELANPVEGMSGAGNARFQEFKSQAIQIEEVVCYGLEDLGAETVVGAGQSDLLLATGVSRMRKSTVETDTDHIPHRIRRGQFTRSGTPGVNETEPSDDGGDAFQ